MSDIATRFRKKFIERDRESCWEWIGAKGHNSYGRFFIEGKMFQAHRVSWLLHRGPIPTGKMVLHKCDNKGCVNPHHLYLGSSCDNARDAIERGQHIPNRKISKTDVARVRELLSTGVELWIIAEIFEVSESTISRIGERSRYRSKIADLNST